MQPDLYPVVGVFRNDTPSAMRLFLEALPAEVILSPGHCIELCACGL